MKREELLHLYSWFNGYVKKFYTDDKDVHTNIVLKEEHTKNVCKNIIKIGKSIGLNENEMLLSEAIGLLHDTGRFEQITRYKTFRDAKSINHALLGVEILKNHSVLNFLDPKERDIIIKAIGYHNVCDLPKDEKAEILMFSKLIRDADKLDALDVVVRYHEEDKDHSNPALEDFSHSPEYSKSIVEGLLNNRNIKYSEVKTLYDKKLMLLAWVFDINFPCTLQQIMEKRYIERIINLLPDTEDIRDVYKHMVDYVQGFYQGTVL